MLGTLTTDQCKFILQSSYIGRIGCYANDTVLVLPVTYVCDGKYIYGRSLEGTKITMMRKNPAVCFQVDCIDDLANWRSVVVQGKFQELKTDAAQQEARKLFIERLQPLTLGQTVDPAREHANPPHTVQKKKKPIIYRITIEEIAGRFEKQVLP